MVHAYKKTLDTAIDEGIIVCVLACICVWACTGVHVYLSMCMCVCVCVCMRALMFLCMIS